MNVTTDIKAILDAADRAERVFGELASDMRAAVADAAKEERRTHAYRNRTGNLQRSTKGRLDVRGKHMVRVSLEMGMPYASFIVGMGLSNFRKVSRDAEAAMAETVKRVADKAVS